MTNPLVTFEMENGDTFRAELYPEVAPNTVNNFISLVKKGFYDGLTFHRIIPGFMHTEGVLSMARAADPDSAGSQFFIMVAAAPHLDGGYAAFGKVLEGMDAVHRAEKVRTNPWSNRPIRPVVIKKITVDTRGLEYPEPETC